jgi:hypothetical protein
MEPRAVNAVVCGMTTRRLNPLLYPLFGLTLFWGIALTALVAALANMIAA